MSECRSYVPGGICRDGFPLSNSSACTGRVCTSCGRPNDVLPPCQDERLGAPWIDESGAPRLARHLAEQQEKPDA